MNYIDEKLKQLSYTLDLTEIDLVEIGKVLVESMIASQMDTKITEDALDWSKENL